MSNVSTAAPAAMVQLFEPARDYFRKMAGEERFMKEVMFASAILAQNSYLNGGSQESKVKAMMILADVPLTLNPIHKEAYLVPRKVGGQLQVVLEPSYMGLVKLLTDSGSVKVIEARPIYQGDDCAIDMSTAQKVLRHVPYFMRGVAKGGVMGFYSLATLHDGSKVCEVMGKDEVDRIMERSESYKAYKSGNVRSAVWITDYDQMGCKTVIKRHWKQLPKTDRMEGFAKAVDIDNADYPEGSQLVASPDQMPAGLPQMSEEQIQQEGLKATVREVMKTYKGEDKKALRQQCIDKSDSGDVDPKWWNDMLMKLSTPVAKPEEPKAEAKAAEKPAETPADPPVDQEPAEEENGEEENGEENEEEPAE